ncbi:RrF2 family transcriptional regulator [Dictyobacter arantiisoli]|uniref:Rrf2 family transcriptional regulator n=1 Tax=Dictyobacter arantiisoli TaxID=2014874 RepID=A0A5A5TI43_9CHLR|nr:Rrf2 family transcriptional regulator [Dictyobacter arantiisoli]GCF10733.1 Rrf2 family transcriptional regulator [Dictyobacter arantiisoli]
MKLSEGVEWGLHCVSVLAGLPSGATLPTKTLAEYHGLSETYLSKHLQALTNARIIESVPGPRGGYRLLRLPEEITLLEIVEAIDGREPLFRCTEIRQRGPLACEASAQAYRLPCGIHVAMARAEKAWREALKTQTLADIVNQYTQDVDPQQQQRRNQWMSERLRSAPKKS